MKKKYIKMILILLAFAYIGIMTYKNKTNNATTPQKTERWIRLF
jgi:hypothetical protein